MAELSEEMRMAEAAYMSILQGVLAATVGLVRPDIIKVTLIELMEETEQFRTAKVRVHEQAIEPSVEVVTAPSP